MHDLFIIFFIKKMFFIYLKVFIKLWLTSTVCIVVHQVYLCEILHMLPFFLNQDYSYHLLYVVLSLLERKWRKGALLRKGLNIFGNIYLQLCQMNMIWNNITFPWKTQKYFIPIKTLLKVFFKVILDQKVLPHIVDD